MKKGINIALVLLWVYGCSVSIVVAAFKLPSSVFRIDQLGEAQDKAKSTNAPIVFLYTDEDTTCGLATAASLDALQEFKDDCVVVYAASGKGKESWAKIPGIVRSAIKSSEAGRFIPKCIIVNPEVTRVISIVPYTRDSRERKELLRRVHSAVSR